MNRHIGAVTAAAVLALGVMASARAQPAGDPQAQQNVRESGQYEKLVCSNPKFRAKRIQQECGPLQGSQFYNSCVASFDCGKGPLSVDPKAVPPSEKIH